VGLYPPSPFSRVGWQRWGPFFMLLRTAATGKWWRRSGPSPSVVGGVWQRQWHEEVKSDRLTIYWKTPMGWVAAAAQDGRQWRLRAAWEAVGASAAPLPL
jgi:hypothetical protein